ncbi:MAG: hypothetical protein QXN93_03555 [Methanomassiliicoccales archaeon]
MFGKHNTEIASAGSVLKIDENSASIDANGMHYRQLNALLKELERGGIEEIKIYNVYGQRYIGTGLKESTEIKIYGIPGNDLGAFMNGPRIHVYGNAQDGSGNTMDNGLIIIHGDAGDVTGYSMRGGKIFIEGNAGFRTGVHLKQYGNKNPTILIGGCAGDFLGEYMAGGRIILLNIGKSNFNDVKHMGIGMHGGEIFIRGVIRQSGNMAGCVTEASEFDLRLIEELVSDYLKYFDKRISVDKIMSDRFTKIIPSSSRPFRRLYH